MIMKLKFAKRMSYIKASEIREILKVTEREDVISFAGGLPASNLEIKLASKLFKAISDN